MFVCSEQATIKEWNFCMTLGANQKATLWAFVPFLNLKQNALTKMLVVHEVRKKCIFLLRE